MLPGTMHEPRTCSMLHGGHEPHLPFSSSAILLCCVIQALPSQNSSKSTQPEHQTWGPMGYVVVDWGAVKLPQRFATGRIHAA